MQHRKGNTRNERVHLLKRFAAGGGRDVQGAAAPAGSPQRLQEPAGALSHMKQPLHCAISARVPTMASTVAPPMASRVVLAEEDTAPLLLTYCAQGRAGRQQLGECVREGAAGGCEGRLVCRAAEVQARALQAEVSHGRSWEPCRCAVFRHWERERGALKLTPFSAYLPFTSMDVFQKSLAAGGAGEDWSGQAFDYDRFIAGGASGRQ